MADSLTHFRQSGKSNAIGSVAIFYEDQEVGRDSTSELSIFGARLDYSREDSLSIVTGDPFAIQVRPDSIGADTLAIGAERFQLRQGNKADSLSAKGSVELWNQEYQGRSDSLSYVRNESENLESVDMYFGPLLWYGENQVSGDTVFISLQNEEIDSLVVRNNTFVATQDTLSSRFNQSRSVNLFGDFENGDPKIFLFKPAAEALFFRSDSTEVEQLSAVRLQSDLIRFHFVDGEIETVKTVKNTGEYFEKGQVPSDLSLAGFKWQGSSKPRMKIIINDLPLYPSRVEMLSLEPNE